MKKILLILMLILINSTFAKDLHFSDYAVPVYQGKMVTEIERGNAYAKLYKTSLKSRLKETGVNFAGHYSLIGIGCGAGCRTVGIVDVRTGKVYHDKWLKAFSSLMDADTAYAEGEEVVDFRKDSRLLILKGAYEYADKSRDGEQGQFWLEFKNGRLRLLKKILM